MRIFRSSVVLIVTCVRPRSEPSDRLYTRIVLADHMSKTSPWSLHRPTEAEGKFPWEVTYCALMIKQLETMDQRLRKVTPTFSCTARGVSADPENRQLNCSVSCGF